MCDLHETSDECMAAERELDANTCKELLQALNRDGKKFSVDCGCDNKRFIVTAGVHYVDVICPQCTSTMRYMLRFK